MNMKTSGTKEETCPRCGSPLPQGVLAGMCAVCLLDEGMRTEADPGQGRGARRGIEPPEIGVLAALFPQLKIEGLLGVGGMGAVYKARQPALDRIVALKVLPAVTSDGTLDRTAAERFRREARALARLSHPNIVVVHEYGEVPGWWYFLMEYVDGVNLRQLQSGGRLGAREALQLIPQICDALQYAHDEGVVHRDIKPENVLVDRKGRVKIADFGLARLVGGVSGEESARLTVEGQVMGTPHYMAPEQLERPLEVDHRADIYSLGVVLYEMLTGELPLGRFEAPSRKVRLDVRLDAVVLKALENDRERRYQQVREIRTGVSEVHGDGNTNTPDSDGVSGRPPAQTPHAGDGAGGGTRILRKKPRLSPVLGCFLLFLAVCGLMFFSLVGVWLLTGKASFDGETRADRAGNKTVSAPIQDAKSPWIAELPERGQIELFALSRAGAPINGWWYPDGTPIGNTAYEMADFKPLSTDPGFKRPHMILRMLDLPEGASWVGTRVRNARSGKLITGVSSAAGGRVLQDGIELSGSHALRWQIPGAPAEIHLEVGLGIHKWSPVFTQDARLKQGQQFRHPGDPKWRSFVHDVSESDGNAQLTMVLGRNLSDWETRVVALDRQGVPHEVRNARGTPMEDRTLWTYEFNGVPLSQVVEFQVQTRPIIWVRFNRVQLDPTGPLPEFRSVKFGEEQDVWVDGWLDLDSGHTASLDGVDDPRAAGFDLLAVADGFRVRDMTFGVASDEAWERLPAAEVLRVHNEGLFVPQHLGVRMDGGWPSTWAYRTHEQGMGLLRIEGVESENDSEGTVRVRLRWKPVVR